MATRLVWSGARIASLVEGRARLHDAGGALIAALPFDARIRDVAFDDAGALLVVDERAQLHHHDVHGARTTSRTLHTPVDGAASLAPRGAAIALDAGVHAFDGTTRWRFRADDYDVHAGAPVATVLAPTGARVAVAHATLPHDHRPPGRGFLVIAIEPPTPPPPASRRARPRPPARGHDILDRHWLQTRATPGPTLFAFDASGVRMIHASPEATPHVGAIRLGKQRNDPARYTVAHPGGAHAIALDPRGIIAAYAYPDAPRRFRVDYLDPADAEVSMIEVLETLAIDPALPDIAALAFSPDSHAIACLSRSGAIEIVPVP